MKIENDIYNEINLFAPQKKKTNKASIALFSILSVILVAFAAATFFPMLTGMSNSAIAKSAAASDKEKEELIDKTMREAQQKLGDDFYKQASGGASIPPALAATKQPTQQEAKPASAQTQAAPAEKQPAKPQAAAQKAKGKSDPAQSQADKLVTVNVTNIGRVNPFVPAVKVPGYYDIGLPKPTTKNINFPEPPTQLMTDDTAVKLMETTISGILFDTFSPSAIIRVEGQDHLVKKGDRINGYKIVNITKDRVVVQNGTNVYRASVGETLSTQGGAIHFNTIDNLEQKFGGANSTAETTMIHIN